jgi:hypothetical protein
MSRELIRCPEGPLRFVGLDAKRNHVLLDEITLKHWLRLCMDNKVRLDYDLRLALNTNLNRSLLLNRSLILSWFLFRFSTFWLPCFLWLLIFLFSLFHVFLCLQVIVFFQQFQKLLFCVFKIRFCLTN